MIGKIFDPSYYAIVATVDMIDRIHIAISYMEMIIWKLFCYRNVKILYDIKFSNKFIIVKNSGNDGYDELYNMCNKIQVLCRLTGILQIIFNTIFWLILPVIYACLKG